MKTCKCALELKQAKKNLQRRHKLRVKKRHDNVNLYLAPVQQNKLFPGRVVHTRLITQTELSQTKAKMVEHYL